MNYKKIEKILLIILLVVTAAVYLYTLSPTLSFWDCGEFIASAYTLAVPHPPGTPFYVLLGRVWLILWGIIAALIPISKEIAWHMNLLGVTFTVSTIVVVYKTMLKILRITRKGDDELTLIMVSFATSLAIAFFFTIWQNAIETEVYALATFVVLFVNYLGLLWYESVRQGAPKHHFILFAFYLIFLSTGIHLIPFLILIPFYIFVFIVERTYVKDIQFILLGIFQILLFALTFLLPYRYHVATVVILGFIVLIAIVLQLNNPAKYRNWRLFWAGVLLVIIGLSTELYLPLRAKRLTDEYKDKNIAALYAAGHNIAPRINECNPGENFDAFNKVLHRDQYGPTGIIPRRTQETNGMNVIEGFFWQMALYVRYMSWQPIPEHFNHIFRAVIYALFYVLGFWGMVVLYKRDKRIFIFMIIIMAMLSFFIAGYLNLRFSPSDPNPRHVPHEVRERDYFFHTGHVYFGIFIGFGFLAFLELIKKETKNKRLASIGGMAGITAFSLIPLLTNITVNNRFGNFIPKDYGYNMLTSCDNGAIVFTNGDNDTFPLWFAQEVLGTKRSVIVANLSLINTHWYIKQLKDWGVPITFSDYVIDRLEPFMTRDRKIVYVKDIMIRNILGANAGISLKNEDYLISQEEFARRYLKGYKGRLPIYFASTVSRENFEGFAPYLQLEGLVYRVTGDSMSPLFHVDIEKTREFFYKEYRYTGVFEPAKQELLAKILVGFSKRKEEGEFYDFAIQKDENTKRLYSNYAAGLHNLGIVLQEKGEIEGTLNAWRFALQFEPQPTYFFDYNLGYLFATLGMNDSAEYYLGRITTRDVSVLVRMASIYKVMGNTNKAIEYFRRAINVKPQIPEAYFGLYSLYIENNDTASARQILKDWLKLNPRDTSAANMLKDLSK